MLQRLAWLIRLSAAALALSLAAAPPAVAQTAPEAQPGAVVSDSAILTIDPERLFAETAFGRRAQREIESEATDLSNENRRIEAELIEEERSLTQQRESLAVEDFRALADAFDAKVDRIRAEQDAKERRLNALRETEQQRFFRQIGPILSQILAERGGLVVLDRRNVIAASERVDITDLAISRIDAEIGDGSEDAADGN